MTDKEMSQSELARQVGVSQSTIHKLTSGSGYGSKYLHRIARILGTTPAYLEGETDDPESDVPSSTLTSQELKWIDQLRGLSPKDRQAVLQLASSLTSRQP